MKILIRTLAIYLSIACSLAIADDQAEPYKNTLKWSTASEVSNFGYDIYRSENQAGPFERVTKSPIEGGGTTDLISRYEFKDDTIDPYTGFYYYIESISVDGVRQRFSSIKFAKAKLTH